MKNITFDLETVTPMFLYGANPDALELRPPSIKGVIRFWWRALNGDLSLDKLKSEEASLFGGTEKEQGRSKLIIRITEDLIHKEREYMLIHKQMAKQDSFKINQPFSIGLSCSEKDNIDLFKNYFYLALVLGGLGKRSRRGFGSVKVTGINEENIDDFDIEDIFKLISEIKPNLYKIEGTKIISKFSAKEEYPYIKEIEIGKPNPDYKNLLIQIGKASSQHNPQNGDCSSGFADKKDKNGKKERLASPLYISVLKNNNQYYPIITTLNTVFPENIKKPFNLKTDQNNFKKAVL